MTGGLAQVVESLYSKLSTTWEALSSTPAKVIDANTLNLEKAFIISKFLYIISF
jgi:hypothetical protein